MAASEWRELLRSTTRLILQGIPLPHCYSCAFPRLAGPLWGSPTESGARSGLSDTMRPGSISELSLSDAVAFRVDFNGRPPPPPLALLARAGAIAFRRSRVASGI